VDAPESDAADPESQSPSPSRPDPWTDPATAGPPPGAPPAGAGAGTDVAAAASQQPQSIRTAVRLMWVGAVLSALGILITFLLRDELRDQIRDSDASLTADEVDTAVTVGLMVVGLTGVIAVALWIWMATANGQGKSWARTVATVLGVLNVVFTLISFAGGQLTPLGVIVNLINIALAVVILVLLYRPDSNRFYDAVSRQASYYGY
jgi:hypothetical protein